MRVRQCVLRAGSRVTTAWLPDRRDLRVGVDVTLRNHPEGADKRWRVLTMGDACDRELINHGWHVGGL